ncbi:MAG: hypothetical protein A2X42_00465 [Candidatus Margulisbacteria bacterium GWF2_38_17]|nr:MAG: hypothetical protein A2X43_10040 [Candidatus Margulisbacteria bacterium GWD2_39_127]OGI03094.1 MAG: hypothetical protein A2X42_00465 [Candidatus Margulisbacteria bacterium GWF2_38_17]OGI07692.1 MAG: hypothetical protein A2X41_04650 [Candidatus Margulisbacteria bacterium GWE2_39_32]
MNTIAIFFNNQKEKATQAAETLQTWLEENNYKYIIENVTATSDNRIKKADLIISLGGDGTTLRAARLSSQYNIPILGVSLGTLGFLAEVSVDKLTEAITNIANDNYTIDERSMLVLKILENGKEIENAFALNEVVVTSTRTRMVMLDVFVSNNYVTSYSADGLIISTPTGSTAYNLSAGGPILSPKLDATIITPICAHSLNLRSLVVSGNDEVIIRPSNPYHFSSALVSLDGQKDINLTECNYLSIKKAKKTVKFIRFADFCFFEALRSKLKWSGKAH